MAKRQVLVKPGKNDVPSATISSRGECLMSSIPVEPSIKELEGAVIKMGGVENATVVDFNHTVCVSIFRSGGCKRAHVSVCSHMRKRYKDRTIWFMENPVVNQVCHKARVREPGNGHFSPRPLLVKPEHLGE